MCGLVGVLTKFGQSGLSVVESDNFDTLLYVDAIRGYDSTGIYGVNRWGNLEWFKAQGLPNKILGSPEFKAYSNVAIREGVCLIGHNRKATVGAIDDESAHPFTEGSITVVHNGKIDNYKSIEPSVSVDSHSVAYLLDKEDYHTALGKLAGAFALIWYDIRTKKVFFCRNDKRPLSIVETGQSFYIGSELEMLNWIVDRSSATIVKRTDIKPGDVWCYDVTTASISVEENVFNPIFTYPLPSTPSHTAGTQHSTGKLGTSNKKSRLKGLKASTLISFEVYDYKPCHDNSKYDCIAMGVTLDPPYEEVRFFCNMDDLHRMEQADYSQGRLAYTSSNNKDGTVTWLDSSSVVSVTKPDPIDEDEFIPVSLNNEILTKQIWSTVSKTCAGQYCRAKITKNDIEYCLTDFSNKRKKIWCPKCSVVLQKDSAIAVQSMMH